MRNVTKKRIYEFVAPISVTVMHNLAIVSHRRLRDISGAISLSWWRRRNLIAPAMCPATPDYYFSRQPQIEDSRLYRRDRMKLMTIGDGITRSRNSPGKWRGHKNVIVSRINSDSRKESRNSELPDASRGARVKSGYLADWTAGMEFEEMV